MASCSFPDMNKSSPLDPPWCLYLCSSPCSCPILRALGYWNVPPFVLLIQTTIEPWRKNYYLKKDMRFTRSSMTFFLTENMISLHYHRWKPVNHKIENKTESTTTISLAVDWQDDLSRTPLNFTAYHHYYIWRNPTTCGRSPTLTFFSPKKMLAPYYH